CQQYHDLLIF
nr:immunoglobulin light chain junction region [Macaca mulatta]